MKVLNSRCGFVTLLGEPNVGKSTLINAFTGSKVSIVTHKAQTTRARVRGIVIEENTQIIMVDTPGLFTPKGNLEKAMVSEAWSAASDSDVKLVLIDATKRFSDGVKNMLKGVFRCKEKNTFIALVINKIDLLRTQKLLAISKEMNSLFEFDATFMISSLKKSGIEELKQWLVNKLPEGPWLYPRDQVADFPQKIYAAEVTREKLFLRLHQELPYNLTVEPDSWITRADNTVRIEQTIFVSHKRHKAMIIGSRGEVIKSISIAARAEIEDFLCKRVHLFLRVKVRENWLSDPLRFTNMGLNLRGLN